MRGMRGVPLGVEQPRTLKLRARHVALSLLKDNAEGAALGAPCQSLFGESDEIGGLLEREHPPRGEAPRGPPPSEALRGVPRGCHGVLLRSIAGRSCPIYAATP